jgi:hypothetical protein
MNKENRTQRVQTTVTPKFDNILRKHAYNLRLDVNDILELYQQAYLEKLEREKAEKKAKKEQEQAEKEKD